ncbi:hypothetical protein PC110_g19700 [Phytophthora cactorum]|uniref:Helitron helicase-like domain-containing protein n=1 Tax=Phytophthora cactorum TaxID=29920 RepID=A0A329RHH0_9STRA|nr:hypothetical protein PC110_g19700 [Phytophthora cactorum]
MHVARNSNPETHNTPTASEVAAIVIDQNTAQLRALGGGFTRIFETHESYDPLQYSLLFPYSERGWSFDLPYVGNPVDSHGNALAMSLRDSTVSINGPSANTSAYALSREKQLQYRLESIQGIADALRNESVEVQQMVADGIQENASRLTSRRNNTVNGDSGEIGRKIILSPKLTSGRRYIYQHFWNAIVIVRETAAPNLFITMTYNPNWADITENLRPGEKAAARPDIVAHVYTQKLRSLNKDLDQGLLGILAAGVYVIEY